MRKVILICIFRQHGPSVVLGQVRRITVDKKALLIAPISKRLQPTVHISSPPSNNVRCVKDYQLVNYFWKVMWHLPSNHSAPIVTNECGLFIPKCVHYFLHVVHQVVQVIFSNRWNKKAFIRCDEPLTVPCCNKTAATAGGVKQGCRKHGRRAHFTWPAALVSGCVVYDRSKPGLRICV